MGTITIDLKYPIKIHNHEINTITYKDISFNDYEFDKHFLGIYLPKGKRIIMPTSNILRFTFEKEEQWTISHKYAHKETICFIHHLQQNHCL